MRLELAPARSELFAGESPQVALRIWAEQEFVERHLQQLSARRLDVPLQIRCDWLERNFTATAIDGATATMALGERVVAATRLAPREFEARTWLGLELRARLPAAAAGVLSLDAPDLRLVYATQFRSTLLDEREAVDARIVALGGELLELAVATLPEEGRPLDFAGAIGDFRLSAGVDREELALGESFRLSVRVEGTGNFGDFDPPRLAPSADYSLVGSLARPLPERLEIVYDLRVLSRRLVQSPVVSLSYFEPARSRTYCTARSAPVALRVRSRPLEGEPETMPYAPVAMGATGAWVLAALSAALIAGAAATVGLLLVRGRGRGSK